MVEHGVYFLDDLTKISVAGTLWSFAFAYFAELFVLAALFASSRRRVGRSRLHRPLNGSFLFIIPLQVWALQASCRAIAFYDMLGWSHGPDPAEGLIVLAENLAGLVILLLLRLVGVLYLRDERLTFGLRPREYAAFTYGLAAVLLDSFFIQAIVR